MKTGRYKRRRTSVSLLHAHIVIIAKYRRQVLDDSMIARAKVAAAGICNRLGAKLQEIDGEADHLHLLIVYPPALALAKLAQRIKGGLSRLLRSEFLDRIRRRLWDRHLWSPSWFVVSCGGAPLATIAAYIQNQGKPAARAAGPNGKLTSKAAIPELKQPGLRGNK